ncbi:MAG: hypothetical protein M1833_002627 [Piccolia ochrophora]|nr:MAG: hypothetical protein M1833_002627 [Piccolia ochrophora]
MRRITVVSPILISLFVALASSQLFLPSFLKKYYPQRHTVQEPIMHLFDSAFPASNKDNPPSGQSGSVRISDVIAKDRAINIFAGFTRDIEPVSQRLEDGSQNTTVLAPLNTAITALPRKPWEDPKDYTALGEMAYDGSEGEGRAHKNLRKFVESHIIAVSPWKKSEKVETMDGRKIWWEEEDGKKMIRPDNVEVTSIANSVGNGEVWMLKEVLNPAS